ncbi:MAG: prepilin-type N-terminal cleavage/methylation domain-containing protein [Elusimicrobiota bacterium]
MKYKNLTTYPLNHLFTFSNGVTLVELMVVVALLAIIFFPLVQVFKSFSNAWWAGKARMSVQSDARDAMYWFVKDLKSAYRHSVGNLVSNGRLDSPGSLTTNPDNWDTLAAGVVVENSTSTRGVCIGVSQGVTYSSTYTFQLVNGVRYLLSGKIRNTDAPLGKGRIEVINISGIPVYASTETDHTSWWEIVTADGSSDGTFLMATTDTDCIIRLSNTGAVGSVAYFEDISVAPKKAVLVEDPDKPAETWAWKIPYTGEMTTGTGYTFLTQQETGGSAPSLARFRIQYTTDSSGKERKRIWRQQGNELNPSTGWESIDYNHIAEYCTKLEIGYEVSDDLLKENGADNGISIHLEFKRSAGGSKLQPYSMKTFIYPQSP